MGGMYFSKKCISFPGFFLEKTANGNKRSRKTIIPIRKTNKIVFESVIFVLLWKKTFLIDQQLKLQIRLLEQNLYRLNQME